MSGSNLQRLANKLGDQLKVNLPKSEERKLYLADALERVNLLRDEADSFERDAKRFESHFQRKWLLWLCPLLIVVVVLLVAAVFALNKFFGRKAS